MFNKKLYTTALLNGYRVALFDKLGKEIIRARLAGTKEDGSFKICTANDEKIVIKLSEKSFKSIATSVKVDAGTPGYALAYEGITKRLDFNSDVAAIASYVINSIRPFTRIHSFDIRISGKVMLSEFSVRVRTYMDNGFVIEVDGNKFKPGDSQYQKGNTWYYDNILGVRFGTSKFKDVEKEFTAGYYMQ